MTSYLASKSPRRRQLLEQLGVAFAVLDVDIPERPGPDEAPVASVAGAADLLAALRQQPGHVFLPCDLNLLDSPLVERSRLLPRPQITDACLLALAVHRGVRERDGSVVGRHGWRYDA